MAEQEITADQDNTNVGEDAVKEESTLLTANEEVKDTDKEVKEETKEEVKEEVKDVAPEKYEDFKFPEGITFDEGIFSKFTDLAKGLNLSQDNAQKVMDLAIENMNHVQKVQEDAWKKTRENWVKEIKTDKEFGGEKFNETLERSKRVMNKYFDKDVLTFLDNTGFGDNPALIKGLAKIDKAFSEDISVNGEPNSVVVKSHAERIYGTK